MAGTSLCLAALVETKTVNGQLSDARVEKHAELHDQYGLHAHSCGSRPRRWRW
ncbi:hypothetical protein HLB42_06710 [Deinococcus sp. D7000]|nr:hypothetical protein HLB42_06710 [Deinococcus sp. D7000]